MIMPDSEKRSIWSDGEVSLPPDEIVVFADFGENGRKRLVS